MNGYAARAGCGRSMSKPLPLTTCTRVLPSGRVCGWLASDPPLCSRCRAEMEKQGAARG